MITGVSAKQNPFPGLRPFREDEECFFFGRESQIDTMVNKLAATRFLAVVGTSGSGKSSLVNCGLRPALHRGLMASAGPAWRMAQFRPGFNAIHSLAQALTAKGVLYSGYKEEVPIEEIVETYLNQSEKGLVETFRKARLPEGTNLLVVVDQFEELFRYQKLGTPDGKEQYTISETATAFVNLLLKASSEPDCQIHVVITMRSDFMGDCSQFYGLPEAMNEGQYLVPRMTRDERRASIAGPVSVGGAEIDPVLLTRLVNDVGDNPDQLSILQHALNRTWACWESHGAQGELELEQYMEIGAMGEALNQHADEAFRQLETPERAKICEKLFKALTDLGTDPRGIRRPLKLATLREIAGINSEDEVKAVIEVFREPSRSFLMPPAPEPLEPEKVIDISHESLMRVWARLRRWAEEEANSARRYRRLAETAALEKAGKARLWRDPDLQLALDWKEEQAPTPTWANLYGGDFEAATAFLERSRSERDHELAEVVFERRWKRIMLFIILLIAGIFLWSAFEARDFEWWLDRFGYRPHVKVPAPQAASLPLAQGLQEAVRDYGGSSNPARLLGALTSFLAPYLLGYFVLAYFGKWVFRRFAFAKILHQVTLSSSKAVREQKLAQQAQALRDAAATLQLDYASFWRRLGAYVLALGLFVVGFWIFLLGCGMAYNTRLLPFSGLELLGSVLIPPIVVGWLFQAIMLSSRRQATLGMLALGIFVTNQKGDRLTFGRATGRYFAKILSYMTLGIGFFIQPFTRKRQALHDLVVRSVVLVRPGKKRVRRWLVALCVVIGLMNAVLLGALLLLVFVAANTQKEANLGWAYQNGLGVPKDLGKAIELYRKTADKGNAYAQNNLGWLYENGAGVPKDLSKAIELFQKSANQGNAYAQSNLGWLYQNGQGVPKDLGKAIELFQKSADQGNVFGQNNLGLLYHSGQGVHKDSRRAAELFQKVADQGNAIAQANLGWLYQNGEGVPKDLRKATELYQKAADQGNAIAQANLGWLYESGQGVPKDLAKAAELFQKAADQGSAPAQTSLAGLYQYGEGVPKDLGKAAELLTKAGEVYQKAADQGEVIALNNLGWLYESGQGVPKDLSKAAELYQKAANQGNAEAHANLAWLYQDGEGVPKDLGKATELLSKAVELYQKAADQGEVIAQERLGWLYQNGQGVPKDLAKASELYQKAADQGYAVAQVRLGWLYENGQGVPKDLRKAVELYQKAADQGNDSALGWLYENGQGVPKDLAKAAELYQKAADKGGAFAQNNLGWLYENGQGVPKDLAKATELYQKAANHGYEAAIANLKRISR
jgi:TPR repeat protein/uncharacterized RDD family membrane protein YckC